MEEEAASRDDVDVDAAGAADDGGRAALRKALGFPAPSEQTRAAPQRRRRGHFASQTGDAEPTTGDVAVVPPAGGAVERVDQPAEWGSAPAWRGDLNQLYAALSERFKVHSEDVTRQLTEERSRLAGLLTAVVERVSRLDGPGTTGEAPAVPRVGTVEQSILASVEKITREITEERQGLVSVVCSIEEQLVGLRAAMIAPRPAWMTMEETELTDVTLPRTVAPARQPSELAGAAEELRRALADQLVEVRAELAEERAGRDAWLQSVAQRLATQLIALTRAGAESHSLDLEPVLAEVRALGRTMASAASAMDRGPELIELRDLVIEAAGQVLPEELAVLQRAISDLNDRDGSGVGVHAIADDLDTMRKELDERLGSIESALAEIRTALRLN